jgi:hypothetical protein
MEPDTPDTDSREQREYWHRELERYRATMLKVVTAMRDQLTDEEREDLQLARELGGRWHANKLALALGMPPIPDDE